MMIAVGPFVGGLYRFKTMPGTVYSDLFAFFASKNITDFVDDEGTIYFN